MNINKLKNLLNVKGTKAKVIRETGITRTTIDNILNGSDFTVSRLEKIVKALGISVGYLFDEDSQVRNAGRDYYEQHEKVNGGKYTQNNSVADLSLYQTLLKSQEKHIQTLESQLKDKDIIIEMLKSKI